MRKKELHCPHKFKVFFYQDIIKTLRIVFKTHHNSGSKWWVLNTILDVLMGEMLWTPGCFRGSQTPVGKSAICDLRSWTQGRNVWNLKDCKPENGRILYIEVLARLHFFRATMSDDRRMLFSPNRWENATKQIAFLRKHNDIDFLKYPW